MFEGEFIVLKSASRMRRSLCGGLLSRECRPFLISRLFQLDVHLGAVQLDRARLWINVLMGQSAKGVRVVRTGGSSSPPKVACRACPAAALILTPARCSSSVYELVIS
jgi:hypothetical protein